jgi:DNA polymerase-3 subunit alpha
MVLEQAQAAGQKAQQDLEIGQGSIFDALDFGGGDSSSSGPSPFAAPAHPPIPAEEFDQPELLAIEKESIGLFISAHPLKQVREALRQVVECSLSELATRKDKDWVSVGGIITTAKKIRTRNGEHMMFATLDDLEGSVEILVFGKALAEYEGALGVDSVVVVRGRVDHKDADKTCLVVQSVEPFEPTPEEIEEARVAASQRVVGPLPFHVRVDAAGLPDTAISDIKHLLANFPGESEVVLEFQLRSGDPLTLKLGPSYKVAPTPTLRAELESVLGPAALIAV